MNNTTINASGTIEIDKKTVLQVMLEHRAGRRPVYQAYRDKNGHIKTCGEALFDAQKEFHKPDAAEFIITRATEFESTHQYLKDFGAPIPNKPSPL